VEQSRYDKERIIMAVPLIDNAKVMSKGQVIIPIDIRNQLNISEGDSVTFICEGDYAIVMNANIYAMRTLQKELSDEWEEAEINNENDIAQLCSNVRAEIEGL
jgi:AbrB family looped-hinge helix DNA binding protein